MVNIQGRLDTLFKLKEKAFAFGNDLEVERLNREIYDLKNQRQAPAIWVHDRDRDQDRDRPSGSRFQNRA